VDVSIGVNVVSGAGSTFAGSRIRALAEAAGLKLESDGLFHYRDERQQTLFTLDNQEPAPFVPEQMKQLNTSGVTLVLDVPRVADGRAALELMLKTGAQLAANLDGALVDDNRVALSEKAVSAIEQQLTSIHSRMEAQGVRAGGDRALRLFS
jgi:FtsZ-interacting cell division protein ZipA